MTSIIFSVTSSLILLGTLVLLFQYNRKLILPALTSLEQALNSMKELEQQRSQLLSQALNLLASKEPIAYQMLQASSAPDTPASVYNGPYLPGEEYEQMVSDEKRLAELWKDMELNDGE
jgi:hypothetical protein